HRTGFMKAPSRVCFDRGAAQFALPEVEPGLLEKDNASRKMASRFWLKGRWRMQSLRILVVEDRKRFRQAVCPVLRERAGRRVRRLVPAARILFISQESSADVAREALRLGAPGLRPVIPSPSK